MPILTNIVQLLDKYTVYLYNPNKSLDIFNLNWVWSVKEGIMNTQRKLNTETYVLYIYIYESKTDPCFIRE